MRAGTGLGGGVGGGGRDRRGVVVGCSCCVVMGGSKTLLPQTVAPTERSIGTLFTPELLHRQP